MGPFESPTRHRENQAAGRRKRAARRPRLRRCLLKDCEQRFHPRQARQRYCSARCRKAARKWSRWKAQQRYRATAAGQQKRNGQSRRYRERIKSRKPPEPEAIKEAARVIPTEYFFRPLLRPAGLLPGIRARAAKSLTTLLLPGLPGRAGARPTTGAALETGARFNPEILIRPRRWPYIQAVLRQLEFHQLERRWEHLRVRHPARQRRLLASLAECGQQTPIVVVAAQEQADRYVVIDGYKRIAALEQLGRDTVEAVEWPMSEAAAVLLDRSLRLSEPETALEVGWLLAELEQRFGYSLEELARRFDRSVSWVSRRLALVEALPEAIQQKVREGKVLAQVAMKFLVPVARQSLEDCQRMAAIFAQHHCDTREAGQLYAAWRQGSPAIRKRILDAPELFFKAQRQAQETAPAGTGAELLRDLEMVVAIVNRAQRRLAGAAATELDDQQSKAARHQIDRIQKQLQRIDEEIQPEKQPHVEPSPTHHDSGTEHTGSEQTGDRPGDGDLARGGAQSPALQLDRSAGTAPNRESRALPATDPGAFRPVPGESRASP
jgi:ParB family transcriptional regulator, chromosome partitioning protein